jgi:hypothetical protein
MIRRTLQIVGIALFLLLTSVTAKPAFATHSWGGYHWARTANPFTLKLGDNLTANWDSYLTQASSDWSQSVVMDTTVVPGLSNPKNCKATVGRVEVCNSKYGNNGWLGIAQIWITGGTHITQGITKLNDTYFVTSTYNKPEWKQLVTCQEVGHTFGLDHQDENFDNGNLGTCMDYTSNPASNQHPNQHDYDELVTIYTHLDSVTTVSQTSAQLAHAGLMGAAADNPSENPGEWGRLVHQNGRLATYERDFGGGQKVVTHVIWAE